MKFWQTILGLPTVIGAVLLVLLYYFLTEDRFSRERGQVFAVLAVIAVIAVIILICVAAGKKSSQKENTKSSAAHSAHPAPTRRDTVPAASSLRKSAPAQPKPRGLRGVTIDREEITFTVADTEGTNSDGTRRQAILRAMRFRSDPYDCWDESSIELEEICPSPVPAIAVNVDGSRIGTVPRQYTADMMNAVNECDYEVMGVHIISGVLQPDGTRKGFGIQITVKL